MSCCTHLSKSFAGSVSRMCSTACLAACRTVQNHAILPSDSTSFTHEDKLTQVDKQRLTGVSKTPQLPNTVKVLEVACATDIDAVLLHAILQYHRYRRLPLLCAGQLDMTACLLTQSRANEHEEHCWIPRSWVTGTCSAVW